MDEAIVLPIRENQCDGQKTVPDGIFEGGVCSAEFEFLAGLRRNYEKSGVNWSCDRAYEVPRGKSLTEMRQSFLAAVRSIILGMLC